MHVRFTGSSHGRCRLLFCRECVVILYEFSRKIRVDITLLQTTMYKSYLFCANYILFVLSTYVDRATHSDVSWLFLIDTFNAIVHVDTSFNDVTLHSSEANYSLEILLKTLL